MPSKIVTVKLPEELLEMLDELVRSGKYSSRNEAIRAAIRLLLQHEKAEAWMPPRNAKAKSKIVVRPLDEE